MRTAPGNPERLRSALGLATALLLLVACNPETADEPASLPPDVAGGDELWEILQRGFEKEPSRRWPNVDELGRELAQWLIDQGVQEDVTGASLVSQWLRAAPAGDVLTSMLPQPMDYIPMPEIPSRRERARWAAETRASEARRHGRLALRLSAWRHQLQHWRHECTQYFRHSALNTQLTAALQLSLFAERPKALLLGALGSALGGALVVAALAPGPALLSEPLPETSEPAQVTAPVPPYLGQATGDAITALLRDSPRSRDEARPPEALPGPRQVRRSGVRPAPPSKLKNPFD